MFFDARREPLTSRLPYRTAKRSVRGSPRASPLVVHLLVHAGGTVGEALYSQPQDQRTGAQGWTTMVSNLSGPRLRALREDRGWTQQYVADQVGRVAWLRLHQRVGVNSDMVAKWEREVKAPSRRYQDLLALVFGIQSWNVAPSAGTKAAPSAGGGQELDASLLDTLGGAASLLDELGPNGSVLQPKMFAVWKEEAMRRRVLLKLMSLAPAVGVSLQELRPQSLQATPEVVFGLEDLADRYQALYHSTTPVVLLTPVLAHLETLRDVLREKAAPALRRKLHANRARVATLAGRISFFDLRDPMAARGYYGLALESSREAGDHLQAATALGHAAFIPAADCGFQSSLDYLRAATEQVGKQPHNLMLSWLGAIESEVHAVAGSASAALSAIDRARAALAAPAASPTLPWFDYYDSVRLEGFAGYAELRAGRLEHAQATLSSALERLPSEAVKQRAVFLCDLANVHVQTGDLDHACRLAGQAADQLNRAGYATGAGRLRELRAAIEPFGPNPALLTLDEHLSDIA